jgi:hypothetical protein
LRDALGEAHRRYTRMINFREGWRGHLWQERFHSFVMDERHLIARPGMSSEIPSARGSVHGPQYWPWSSARAHLAAADDELVSVRPLLELVSDWDRFISASLTGRTSLTCCTHIPAPAARSVRTPLSKISSNASGVRSSEKNPGRRQHDQTLTLMTSLRPWNGNR